MFTLKTGKAEQYLIEGQTLLKVPFDIIEETKTKKGKVTAKVVHSMAQSFPLTATAKEIKAALARHLEVYIEDHNRFEANKEQQAALEASAETAKEISNLQF